ncbi:MAG: alpha/beta hydrolase [Saprospiraceae bacterium]|nr:alpha/beta hydrolase [Saprospiraceae bacterium]
MIGKVLKIFAIATVILLVSGIIYMKISLPQLPANADRVIAEVIKTGPPPLKGQEGYAYNGNVKIWYESRMPDDSLRGTILLIMGMSNDALSWPEYFIDPLVESGYQVVRMDNRGTGLSDWEGDWSLFDSYTLEDMALDAIAVLDLLKIETSHVIGISLGGMITQTLAIHHPKRVSTLTSIMSSGYMMDDELPATKPILVTDLFMANLRYGLVKSESNTIKLHLLGRALLKGDNKYDINVEETAKSVLYNYRNRKGDNPLSFQQQTQAILKSGSRYEGLQQLNIPTLIIHGVNDPMVPFEHGKKCYEMIPNARKLWIDGLGHDIPELYAETISKEILKLIKDHPKDEVR